MRNDALPSPGVITGAEQLRRLAAKAISYQEVQADRRGEPAPSAEDLRAFFQACADAVPAVVTEP